MQHAVRFLGTACHRIYSESYVRAPLWRRQPKHVNSYESCPVMPPVAPGPRAATRLTSMVERVSRFLSLVSSGASVACVRSSPAPGPPRVPHRIESESHEGQLASCQRHETQCDYPVSPGILASLPIRTTPYHRRSQIGRRTSPSPVLFGSLRRRSASPRPAPPPGHRLNGPMLGAASRPHSGAEPRRDALCSVFASCFHVLRA
jgi:hypothetical protein